MADAPKPGMGDPLPPVVVPPQPPAPVVTSSAEPFAVFPDKESFEKRLEREARRRMREYGVEDPETIKASLDELHAMRAQADEVKKSQMTELDRMRADLSERDARIVRIEAEAAEKAMRAHLYEVFANKKIANFEYALFKVTNKLAQIGDDEELDEGVFLDELLTDPVQRIALGVDMPPQLAAPVAPQAPRGAPVTSTPAVVGAPGAPQPGGAQANGAKTAFDQNPTEWAQTKAKYGIP